MGRFFKTQQRKFKKLRTLAKAPTRPCSLGCKILTNRLPGPHSMITVFVFPIANDFFGTNIKSSNFPKHYKRVFTQNVA